MKNFSLSKNFNLSIEQQFLLEEYIFLNGQYI